MYAVMASVASNIYARLGVCVCECVRVFVCVETGLIIIFIMHRTVQIIIIKKYTRKVKKQRKAGRMRAKERDGVRHKSVVQRRNKKIYSALQITVGRGEGGCAYVGNVCLFVCVCMYACTSATILPPGCLAVSLFFRSYFSFFRSLSYFLPPAFLSSFVRPSVCLFVLVGIVAYVEHVESLHFPRRH